MAIFGFGKQQPVEAEITIQTDNVVTTRKTTSDMTQEELRIRRMRTIEASKFGRPIHETIMLFFLKIWLIIGPPAFVALTSSEVAYILTQLVPAGDTASYVILGGALFIDLAMMFVTFGVAIKRRDLAEKREANGGVVPKRDELEVLFGTIVWVVFAVINMISQCAFLLHIVNQSPDKNGMTILYVFVASRVIGFILGDASTAFFLAKVDNSEVKLIARAEREKAALYSDISKAEGERQLVEAKADAEMRILRIEVKQKEEEAAFMSELKRQMFQSVLIGKPSTPELGEPNKSKMRRLDSSTS